MMRFNARLFSAALGLAVAAAPLGALAQSQPETISGSVASINDSGAMELNDDRGFVDSVQLQQDTVIGPQRVRLQPGMRVSITGAPRGNVFNATQVTVIDQGPQLRRDDAPAVLPPPAVRPESPAAPPPFAAGDLTGTLSMSLDSKDAYVGQEVFLSDVSSADGSIRGASLSGTVTDVTRPSQGHAAQLNMHFDRLKLRNGSWYRIEGVVASMNVTTKNNTLKEIGGALAGMLAGNAIAKTVFGVSGGGLIGAVGGYFIAKDNRTDVVIPANTAVTVHVERARRQTTNSPNPGRP
jgi:hypothetical protein